MENSKLFYEITPKEKKDRNGYVFNKFLHFLPLAAVLGALYAIMEGKFEIYLLDQYIYFWLAIAMLIVLAIGINRLFPYQYRSYSMDGSGIVISKGKKVKKYSWDEFSSFFIHEYPVDDSSGNNSNNGTYRYKGAVSLVKDFGGQASAFEGKTFYLVKKTNGWGRLAKKFIVVYAEPENSQDVDSFLSLYVIKRKMQSNDDLGMIFYEFK